MEGNLIKFSRYIAEDFSKFCERFVEYRSLSYDAFLSLWKKLSFDNLFAGHSEEKECNEFGRELLRAGADYMASFNEPVIRVLGIYMCYAICQTYPYDLKIKIRLTLEEWKDLVSFIEEVEKQISAGICSIAPGKFQELYDIVHVFDLMRKGRSFVIAATRTEVCLVSQTAQDEDERPEDLFNRPRAIEKIFTTDMLDKLTESVAEYELQKQMVMEKYPEIAKSLDVSTGDIVQKITKQLVSNEDWKRVKTSKKHEASSDANDTEEDQEPGKVSEDSENDIAERRKKIKTRAMGGKDAKTEIGQNEGQKKTRRHRKRKWKASHSVSNLPKKPRVEDKEVDDEASNAETLALLGDMLS